MQTGPYVFICYRRDDSGAWAGRIADRLISQFGRAAVFYDIESICPGSDFVRSLSERTASCDVLLAIIGNRWLEVRNARGQRRLDEPNDFVRLEIGNALRRGVRVIPVLVSDAEMPQEADLPADIAPLAQRGAINLSLSNYQANMDRLVSILEREGARRMLRRDQQQVGPRPSTPPQLKPVNYDADISAFLNKVAADMAAVYPWLRSHRLISAALVLLAILTFSPLWLPPERTVAPQVESPQPVEPVEPEPDHKLQRVFVVVQNEPFSADDLRHELESDEKFAALKMEMVDDRANADALLEVRLEPSGATTFELKLAETDRVLSQGSSEKAHEDSQAVKKLVADLIAGLQS